MKISDVAIVGAGRTAIGKFGGTLRDVMVYELGASVIKGVLEKTEIKPTEVDEVLFGNTRQAGNGPNPARTASVLAGIPVSIPCTTINKACPSGMKCVQMAIQSIMLGDARIVIAGGMESMSTIPYILKNVRWEGFRMGDKILMDGWNDTIDPLCNMGMGETAENLVKKYGISREEQDQFAFESHMKASQAQKLGYFDNEIIPIEVYSRELKQNIRFSKDESIRANTSLDALSKLKPVFRKDGTITAGNACGMSDGAAALILTTRDIAKAKGLKPLFSVISYASAAVEPSLMGEGPSVSIPQALKKAGMSLTDADLIEVNEAFAAQILANERVLKWDRGRLNIHGGAIALGHPTGMSGARILITLYYALKRINGEIGVAGICGGGGVTMAMVIRRET